MSSDLNGKVALVTGAASGIGLATAKAFAEAKARVVLADRNEQAVAAAAQALVQAGHDAVSMACDVADEAQVSAMVQLAVSKYGRLDVAFNCAGILPAHADIAQTSVADFERVLRVNVTGVWLCMKHETQQMLKQGGAGCAIVNASSIAGLVAYAGVAAYIASKHAVIGLTKSAAVEYAPRGIRINAICPGLVDTPMGAALLQGSEAAKAQFVGHVPAGRLASPEEIAKAVLWLCGSGASYMHGNALVIDGGYTAQ